MTKIMLVEDDNNLREIYEARLLAEGYEIFSAKDGEEALAMAVKENPDLIISDIMMPKISGFDMLDILRSTPETKNTKVIMMTALSQSEDKARADKLGADRYLVKSQVTLEDVAKVAREVLSGEQESPAPVSEPASATPSPAAPAVPPSSPAPTTADDPPVSTSPPANPIPVTTDDQTSSTQVDPVLAASLAEEEASVGAQTDQLVTASNSSEPKNESNTLTESSETAAAGIPPAATPPQEISVKEAPKQPEDASSEASGSAKEDEIADAVNDIVKKTESPPETEEEETANSNNVPIAHKKVIEPINDMTEKAPDLNDLVAKEEQKDAISPVAVVSSPPIESVIQPGGATIIPVKKDGETNVHTPGNVITPSGGTVSEIGTEQPSDLAL